MRPNRVRSRFADSEPIPAVELSNYIDGHRLDTSRNCHQLIAHLEQVLQRRIPLSTMILAALFSGLSVAPMNRTFRFVELENAQ